MAADQGFTEAELRAEVGDIEAYIRTHLQAANKTEHDRGG
jgi:hypothetical protein